MPAAGLADDCGGSELAGVPQQGGGIRVCDDNDGLRTAAHQSPRQPAEQFHRPLGQIGNHHTVCGTGGQTVKVGERPTGLNDHLLVVKLPSEFRLPVGLALQDDNRLHFSRPDVCSHGAILGACRGGGNGHLLCARFAHVAV
jgi:hypothetical protein